MRSTSLLPAIFLLLGSSHFDPPPARRGAGHAAPTAGQSCAMPATGAPAAAARAAAARGDQRLMAYWQNGFAVMLVAPGLRNCDAGGSRAGGRRGNFRMIAISIDRARSPQCCDMPWTPDACGVRQQDYAAAYNLEMVRVARRRLPCRAPLVEPGRR